MSKSTVDSTKESTNTDKPSTSKSSSKKSKEKFLCHIDDLDNLSSKSFSIKLKRKTTDIFIVKKDDKAFAYINVCPHAGAPLEWNPNEFLDENKESIICAMHGAQFSIEEGNCIGGPCNGEGLTKVSLEIQDKKIFFK